MYSLSHRSDRNKTVKVSRYNKLIHKYAEQYGKCPDSDLGKQEKRKIVDQVVQQVRQNKGKFYTKFARVHMNKTGTTIVKAISGSRSDVLMIVDPHRQPRPLNGTGEESGPTKVLVQLDPECARHLEPIRWVDALGVSFYRPCAY